MMRDTARSYRTSGTENATHLEILLATYDAVAEDMRLAGEAAERGDISARCRYSQHALLLAGHLESWVPLLEDETLQTSLVRFYGYLREQLLRLQATPDPGRFAELAMLVCETRAVWHQKGSQMMRPLTLPTPEILAPEPAGAEEASRFSWSA